MTPREVILAVLKKRDGTMHYGETDTVLAALTNAGYVLCRWEDDPDPTNGGVYVPAEPTP